jgi:two-component system, sensor histidine kinase and response regulator
MGSESKSAVLDQQALMECAGGDIELVRELSDLFLEGCPEILAGLRAAVEAHDPAAVHRLAHSLKGSVANFGGKDAYTAAQRLEQMGRSGLLVTAPQAYSELEREIERFSTALRSLAQIGTQF